jgi:hypothetical protein
MRRGRCGTGGLAASSGTGQRPASHLCRTSSTMRVSPPGRCAAGTAHGAGARLPHPLGPHGSGFPERDRPHARLPADFGYQGRTRPGCPAAALTDEFAAWTWSPVRGQGDEMAITRILAQMTVADLTVATQWYSRLFGREPDARPMEGLIEWHLADAFGVQVWAESDRAGRSTMVLDESDLDAFCPRTGPCRDSASGAAERDDIAHPVTGRSGRQPHRHYWSSRRQLILVLREPVGVSASG